MEKFTHTITISELKKQRKLGDFSDVVIDCNWQLKTTYNEDLRFTEVFIGSTSFQVNIEDLSNNFINFSDLTESDLISWIELDISRIKKRVEKEMLEKIENPCDVVKCPWDNDNDTTSL